MNIKKGIITFIIGYFLIQIIENYKPQLKNIPIINFFLDNYSYNSNLHNSPSYNSDSYNSDSYNSPSHNINLHNNLHKNNSDMYLLVFLYSLVFSIL
jgi:hypothetical protein